MDIVSNKIKDPWPYHLFRFEFLSRSGQYLHPDPGAKSAVPTEASPLLHLITDTDDER